MAFCIDAPSTASGSAREMLAAIVMYSAVVSYVSVRLLSFRKLMPFVIFVLEYVPIVNIVFSVEDIYCTSTVPGIDLSEQSIKISACLKLNLWLEEARYTQ